MSSSELAGLRILIVEDNPIISLDVAETWPTLARLSLGRPTRRSDTLACLWAGKG